MNQAIRELKAVALRPVRRGDVDALAALCVEHAAYERCHLSNDDGRARRLHRALFQPSPRLWAWVVVRDGELVGFASASLEYSTWQARDYLHLDCLYLRSDLRGQGWGSRLLEHVVEQARRLDCGEVQWQTPPWNEKAIAFYEAKGATGRPKLRFTQTLAD